MPENPKELATLFGIPMTHYKHGRGWVTYFPVLGDGWGMVKGAEERAATNDEVFTAQMGAYSPMPENPYNTPVLRCAGPKCEAVKRETNHWFVIHEVDGAFGCWPFDPQMPLQSDERPVCGQQCAQRRFQQYLDRKKAKV